MLFVVHIKENETERHGLSIKFIITIMIQPKHVMYQGSTLGDSRNQLVIMIARR